MAAVGGLVGVIELETGAKAGVLQASASRPVKMRVTYLQRFTILDLRFAIGLLHYANDIKQVSQL
jgi:hypothetical protein